MITLLLLCVVGLVTAVPTMPLDETTPRPGEKCGYESCTDASPDVLNVHIVAHTHDDVGWLKTVDQYYYGSLNTIQKAGVKYILDSVVKELWEDPKRKFIYVETAFFWKWWIAQPAAVQSKVHTLVRQGRLQFVGGAWSMNDEAASHYQSTVDQFTWGLRKLNETFGACGRPTVGWQIDPFGHSREFANNLALMGYDGLFLGRIDYQDKRRRMNDSDMEMVWRGSDELGSISDIFTGVLYNTYSPPPGFCFDVLCNDEPIVDDTNSPMYNVDERVRDFLEYVLEEGKHYRSNNVLVTMGGDFTYQDAFMWFDNLDKLIKYANLKAAKDGLKVKLFYSTPACYLKAVKDANSTLPIKQDDFFPYASDSTAFWTGYFTSRPTTKFMEREGNNYLQTFKMLQVLADLPKTNSFVLNELKSAMGVMQHHDAITGTEKQHVARDYERIMARAVADAFIVPSQAFNKIMKTDEALEYQRCEFNQSQCSVTEESDAFVLTVFNNQLVPKKSILVELPVVREIYTVHDKHGDELPAEIFFLSPDYLSIPTRKSKSDRSFSFIVKDLPALGFESFYIKKEKESKRAKRGINKKIYDYYSNINDYWKDIKDVTEVEIKNYEIGSLRRRENENVPERGNNINEEERDYDKHLNWDVLKDGERKVKEGRKFDGKVKDGPKAFPSFNDEEMRMLADDPMVVEIPEDVLLQNEYISLAINTRTGWINYTSKSDGTSLLYHTIPGYYIGCAGNNWNPGDRSSGAYIFRPNMTVSPELITFKNIAIVAVILTDIKQEVTLRYDDTVTLTIGLKSDTTYFSSILSIEEGREHVLRFVTDLKTNGVFYTDSNGRQMLKRIRNERPQWNITLKEPIPGNYYPVVNEMYIEDDDMRVILNIDRARGGSSLKDGSFEIMQHRRLTSDDAFGVGEALNETAGGKGLYSIDTIYLQVVNKNKVNLVRAAELSHSLFSPPQFFVADAKSLTLDKFKKMTTSHSFVRSSIPKGIHLLTLEQWSDKKILIRLENYFDKNTSPAFISVDMSNIFKSIEILSMKETTLAANVWLSDYKQTKWITEEEFSESFNLEYGGGGVGRAKDFEKLTDGVNEIKLRPKQIRTFIVEYKVVG